MKAHLITGGGIRGGCSHAARLMGERLGKFNYADFDVICGDSYGSFDAALTANGWPAKKQIELFLSTDIEKLVRKYDNLLVKFLPWNQRKLALLTSSLKLKGLAEFIDGLGLTWPETLIITCTDAKNNVQLAACKGKKPSWENTSLPVKTVWVEDAEKVASLGTWITRSMALPGLEADDLQYMDAGVIEHPPISFLPFDTEITAINLGYAGDVAGWEGSVPKGIIDRLGYCYERAADTRQDLFFLFYPNTFQVCPEVFTVDSLALNMTRAGKVEMLKQASVNSVKYWSPNLDRSHFSEVLDYIFKFYRALNP